MKIEVIEDDPERVSSRETIHFGRLIKKQRDGNVKSVRLGHFCALWFMG